MLIHKSSYIDPTARIDVSTKVWHFCNIMKNVKIGKNCILGQNVMIGEGVIIGNNVKIQNNVSVYSGVEIEDNVFLGPSCVFTNVVNPRSEVIRKNEFKKTIISKGVTIGANATIICGNKIEEYAMIGAGAVVTKDIACHRLAYGNPATYKGWVTRKGHIFDNNFFCKEKNLKLSSFKEVISYD